MRHLKPAAFNEDLGITGHLVDIDTTKPDPIVHSGALRRGTRRIEFILACRYRS